MKLTKKIKDFLRPDIRISRFCIKADMSRSTFVRRLKNPENFTVKEVQVLKEMSGLTEKEIFQTEKENSQN